MQRQPLPKLVDARKFASVGSEIRASVPVSDLNRFVEGLASERGNVDVDLRFFRDEQGFFRISGGANAGVEVLCQRCLEAMPLDVKADIELAVVWNDEQAKALPKSLDPLVLGDELLSLVDVVQDELILAAPFVSYHPAVDCTVGDDALSFQPPAEEIDSLEKKESGESPFSVLEKLRSRDSSRD